MEMRDYKWEMTDQIRQLLIELEAVKISFEALSLSPQAEENLRKTALLKSAVYSVRIEGFPDTLAAPKLESQKLMRAYRLVHSLDSPSKPSLSFIRELHRVALDKLSGDAGKWRREAWGIFNQAGVAVYVAPAHFNIPSLMADFVNFISSTKDQAGVKAAVAQFIFEKIHPFADGNGRVGRLISAHILAKSGYGFRGLAPFEEYIDEHRLDYYAVLEPSHKITSFVEFFLNAVVTQSKESLSKIIHPPAETTEGDLPPRQGEILEIVRDHPYCSFDFLQRRFVNIKPSTLRYDVTQVIKSGLIKKIRKTRGAMYLAVTDILK